MQPNTPITASYYGKFVEFFHKTGTGTDTSNKHRNAAFKMPVNFPVAVFGF